MKFNTKYVYVMCKSGMMFLILLVMISCTKTASEKLFTVHYPEIYNAIYERNADNLLEFTKHESELVKHQAWRAMMSTEVDSMNSFFDMVKDANNSVAWSALSMQDLNKDHLKELQNTWINQPSARGGISLVLGRQGELSSLEFLIENFDKIIDSSHEYESALAIGRLIGKYDVSSSYERVIVQYAAIQDDPEIFRAYFYGYYRSGKTIEDQRLQDIMWETYEYSTNPLIKQYAMKISFQNDAERFFEQMDIAKVNEMNVQLAIEFAKLLTEFDWNEKVGEAFENLLRHKNSVVNEVALAQLQNQVNKPQNFDEVIIAQILGNDEKEASVKLSGIAALENRSEYIKMADSLAAGDDYLLVKKLNIYQEELSVEEFISEMDLYMNSINRLQVLFGTQALGEWWNSLPTSEKTTELVERVRILLFAALDKADRSITYHAKSLLLDRKLIAENDFSYLNEMLLDFALPKDVEVYQSMSEVFKERFEEQAQSLIDSLALEGNKALNTTLIQHEWEIPAVEEQPTDFLEVDWNRLADLGFFPVWVLETEKGTIQIQMDAITAPATIFGMDSLITSGSYDSVAFHRVAPNFVVQGGDVETGDGFGGPDYVVPTEASEKNYKRGMVGIASAGTDTEGSQYFIMHQWAPHLNGRYTIIGEVIEGMDVVDKLLIGDMVERTYWRAKS